MYTYTYLYIHIYIYMCVCVCLPTMILVIALQVITSSSVNSLFLDILSSSPWNLFHRNAIDIIQQSYMKIAFLSHFPGAIASIKSALMVRLLSGVIATSASRCPSLAISLWGINRLMRGPVWRPRQCDWYSGIHECEMRGGGGGGGGGGEDVKQNPQG